MKGHTKGSQQQSVDVQDQPINVQETTTQVQDQIGISSSSKLFSGMKNLIEMDEYSLFNEIPSEDMVPKRTIKLHYKKMWDDYFENKSIIGRTQLFAKLFLGKEK